MSLFRKLFLVKEICSKQGVVHFRRYRLLQTPWFAFYIHQICQSDSDKDMHDHPWNFLSLILKGAYREASKLYPDFNSIVQRDCNPGNIISHSRMDAHQITLLTKVVWTLVFTFGRRSIWGYQTPQGWIRHDEYRKLKNEGKL